MDGVNNERHKYKSFAHKGTVSTIGEVLCCVGSCCCYWTGIRSTGELVVGVTTEIEFTHVPY